MSASPSLFLLISLAAVTALPEFTRRPDSLYSVVEGESLTVVCNATDVLFYLWELEGEDLVAFPVPGVTVENQGRLTISPANHSLHRGNYRCTIHQSTGAVLRADFTVAVYYIGTGISLRRRYTECESTDVYVGSSLTLECLPPDGDPMVNITWYRNGEKLRQRENESIEFNNGRRELVISPLATAHSGTYHCQATNSANEGSPEESEGLSIHVVFPRGESVVSVVDEDQPLVVGEGLSAELVCKIIPPVSIEDVQWWRNGQPLSHDLEDGVRFVQRGHPELACLNTLHLDSVTPADEGAYQCSYSGSSATHHPQRQLSLAGEWGGESGGECVPVPQLWGAPCWWRPSLPGSSPPAGN